MTDSFANKTALTPEGFEINGGTYFTLNKQNYLIYPYSDYNTTGHAYNLTKVNSNYDFNSMELMWEFPKGSIGMVNSATYQAEVDYVLESEGVARVYVYVPGNGIAAYELNDTSISGVESLISDGIDISLNGNEIILSKNVDRLAIYNMFGVQMINATNASAVDLDVLPGFYIVEITDGDNVISKKILVK